MCGFFNRKKKRKVVAVLLRVLGYRGKRWKSPAKFYLVCSPEHKAELLPTTITCTDFSVLYQGSVSCIFIAAAPRGVACFHPASDAAQLCLKLWTRQHLGLLSAFVSPNRFWLTSLSWRGCSWAQNHWREGLYGWGEGKDEGEENNLYSGKYNTKSNCWEISLATNYSLHWQPIIQCCELSTPQTPLNHGVLASLWDWVVRQWGS